MKDVQEFLADFEQTPEARNLHGVRAMLEGLQSQLATAREQLIEYEQTEAAVCPEDVGIERYAASLLKQLATANEQNEKLREALGVKDFEVDGMLAVGQELIRRQVAIEKLREAMSDVLGHFKADAFMECSVAEHCEELLEQALKGGA